MRYSSYFLGFLLMREIEVLIQITGKYSVANGKGKGSRRASGDALGWYVCFLFVLFIVNILFK